MSGINNTNAYGTTNYDMPMKWHKFLIYFSLWASAIINLINAVMTMTGMQYGNSAKFVYMYYDGLKALDVIFGIAMIIFAIATISVRFQLANMSEKGPRNLPRLYGASLAITLIYNLLIIAITEVDFGDVFTSQTVTSIISNVAYIFINKSYYDKRSHMFI